MKHISYNFVDELYKKIEESSQEDFIQFAKNYNIFQPNGTAFYRMMCDKIKARCDREGLDYNIVKPD